MCWPYGSVASLVLACVFPHPITSTLVRRFMDMDMDMDMDMYMDLDIDMDPKPHALLFVFPPFPNPLIV